MQKGTPKMAILVVDDDRALLDALTSLVALRMPGTHIETCESAEAAFQRLETDHYDLLISDINLPGADSTCSKRPRAPPPRCRF